MQLNLGDKLQVVVYDFFSNIAQAAFLLSLQDHVINHVLHLQHVDLRHLL